MNLTGNATADASQSWEPGGATVSGQRSRAGSGPESAKLAAKAARYPGSNARGLSDHSSPARGDAKLALSPPERLSRQSFADGAVP